MKIILVLFERGYIHMIKNETIIEINKENLFHNMDYLKNHKKKQILPVVKANAYGHGMDKIIGLLYEWGQRIFAVARFSEYERIHNMGYDDVKILVFESIGDYSLIKDRDDIFLSANTLDELKDLLNNSIDSEKIQIKIDMGFGRNGIYSHELEEIKKITKNLHFAGIYSHLFAVNYDDGLEYIKIFEKIINYLGKENFSMIHLQNTATTLSYDIPYVSHVRVGMGIYGLQDDGFMEKNLKQVFSLKSKIDSIREIDKYFAYRENDGIKKIGKIKLGYADGFLKSNEGSYCLIGNREHKILQVTMDNTFIEIDQGNNIGDTVDLYHNVYSSANYNNRTIYELTVILSPRLHRIIK